MNLDGLIERTNDTDGSMRAEIDGGGTNGREKSSGKLAGIEAVLFEKGEAVVARYELREETGQLDGRKRVGSGEGFMRERLQGFAGLERDIEAGELAKISEVVGVKGDAETG